MKLTSLWKFISHFYSTCYY